jgi:thiol:disulfide interchange protein DsbD
MSMVVWAFTLRGRARGLIASIALACLACLVWAAGPHVTKPAGRESAAGGSSPWQAWEPGRVDKLLAGGQPVFVDFTAAWCVTCQYNEKTTLSRKEVLADLAAKNVAMLRADWTRREPAITVALGQLGRNGVPVYVFYRNGAPPIVLSELLSVNEVRAAIAKL